MENKTKVMLETATEVSTMFSHFRALTESLTNWLEELESDEFDKSHLSRLRKWNKQLVKIGSELYDMRSHG